MERMARVGGKRSQGGTRKIANNAGPKRAKRDENIKVDWEYDSDSSDGNHAQEPEETEEEVRLRKETAQERRVRMAKEMLAKVSHLQEEEDDDDEDDSAEDGGDSVAEDDDDGLDPITKRLHTDLLRAEGRLRREVANEMDFSTAEIQVCKQEHMGPLTSIAISESEEVCYTASKDCSIIKWDVETGEMLHRYPGRPSTGSVPAESIEGHFKEILSISLSHDGRYLASGGRDNMIRIWDTRENRLVESFSGHRDAVSGVSFQKTGHTLYSCSFDRSVRVWNVSENAFVEALFGHQSNITSVDSMFKERCVTSSEDRTVRYWKIPEESQLVFQGHHPASLDCIKMIDEIHFVTGSQDGTLALWHSSKKKPCSVIKHAHAGWISSVTSLRNTDLICTGANDGSIKFWKVDLAKRIIQTPCVGEIPIKGHVNGLAFGISGNVLVAAVGREQRLGRWDPVTDAANKLHIIRFPNNSN